MTSIGVKSNVGLPYAKREEMGEIEKAIKKLQERKISGINGILSFQNGTPMQIIPEGRLEVFFLFDLLVVCLGASIRTAGVKGLAVNLSSPVL